MDIKSSAERSRNMAKIRAKDTKPELFIRSALHRLGYRFSVNARQVEGCPDIYFTRKRIAIFVHGCYWHRHAGCKHAYTPKSNVDFWQKKFSGNIERDKDVMESLHTGNIRTAVVWECTVRKMMSSASAKEAYLSRLKAFLDGEGLQNLEL